jgi:hypothetical protein
MTVNLGRTNASRKIVVVTAKASMIEGYVSAPLTRRRVSCSSRRYPTARLSSFDIIPDFSLAFISETNRRGKLRGCRASAAEKLLPSCTLRDRSWTMAFTCGRSAWAAMHSSASASVTPVSVMIPSWYETLIRSAREILMSAFSSLAGAESS